MCLLMNQCCILLKIHQILFRFKIHQVGFRNGVHFFFKEGDKILEISLKSGEMLKQCGLEE